MVFSAAVAYDDKFVYKNIDILLANCLHRKEE